MKRRDFLGMMSGTVIVWPRVGRTQQPRKPYLVVWMSTESQPDPFLEGFRDGMRERGYVEGRDVRIELRYAPGNPEALRAMVADVIRLKPDLVVSSGPAIRAMKEAKDVSVVFAISGDPVELGIAQSLARPGGNFTGRTFLSLELAGKRVELLKEALPQLRTLAILSNTDHPGERSELGATRKSAESVNVAPAYFPFRGPGELDGALAAVRDARAEALLVFPEGVTMVNRAKIAEFANTYGLPSMFGWREYCDAGGLMSFGANQRATHVQLAAYADRVLRGEKPAVIPIEQPTRFELVVNAKTARALTITIPQSILLRADDIIE